MTQESITPKYHFTLSANEHWPLCQAPIPKVQAALSRSPQFLCVNFNVLETPLTYRAQVQSDGGDCWKDSCVEIFMQIPQSNSYLNLEFSASGHCLGAKGESRHNRLSLNNQEYRSIQRRLNTSIQDSAIQWNLQIQIPWNLIGPESQSLELKGNLQKCGDLSAAPHWMSAFVIDTPKPDFHRPEFFGLLLPASAHF